MRELASLLQFLTHSQADQNMKMVLLNSGAQLANGIGVLLDAREIRSPLYPIVRLCVNVHIVEIENTVAVNFHVHDKTA